MANKHQTQPALQDLGPSGYIQGLDIISTTTQAVITRFFAGVRYAQPPTDSLRFRRTRPLPADYKYGSTTDPAVCTRACNICPQPGWPGVLEPSDPSTWDEDCVHANIWIPPGKPPKHGWPVLFYIHGGFLQFGHANRDPLVVANMYEETGFRAVIVMPAYRLSVLGFLAGRELQDEARRDGERAGNMGFWDQRTALEWTGRMIGLFGGDPGNITVGGYSAVTISGQTCDHVVEWVGRTTADCLSASRRLQRIDFQMGVPPSATASQKLEQLRQVPAVDLIRCVKEMSNSQFRGTTDGDFVSPKLIDNINSGDYGRRMKDRGVKLLIGDCRDEHNLYRAWITPENSWQAVHDRLLQDYPPKVVRKIMDLYSPGKRLPQDSGDWKVLFGKIYADIQVHCLERGFVQNLVDAGLQPGRDVFRYRIETRVECTDAAWPRSWEVTHATDEGIWWWGNGWAGGLTAAEKQAISPMHALFSRFVHGEGMDWDQTSPRIARRLTQRGTIDWWEDDRWDEALVVWKTVNGDGRLTAKLA